MRSALILTASFGAVLFAVGCSKSTQGEAVPPGPSSSTTAAATTAPPAAGADTFKTSKGDFTVHPVMHATVWFDFGGKTIVVDPWSKAGEKLDAIPKADYLFITDIHPDHFDQAGIDKVKKAGTVIIGPKVVADKLAGITVMANGEKKDFGGFSAEAVPMYNLQRGPEAGKLFHDKGRGNGYVLTLGDKRVYLSGDTECTPEMKALQSIDVAFVCMNLPYTMPPSEAGECVRAFKPKVLYPYHYKDSNPDELGATPGTEVRKRNWY